MARTPARSQARHRLATIVAVILLVLPLPLGIGLGWFGLNGPMEERVDPVGALSHELLSSFPDDSLTVEIAAPAGELPPASAISTLWSRMNETLQKGSISFELQTYSNPSHGALTTADLFALEGQVRTSWPTIGSMALFYLVVDGSYAGGSSVLGLAYAASSIAVFSSTFGPSGMAGNAAVAATMLVHEFGHEIGLVGVVGNAPNQDPNHPGHSTDPNDVMYWQVETTAILGGLLGGGGPPTQFDSQDLGDLQTVKATPIPQEFLPWLVVGVLWSAATAVLVLSRRDRRTRAALGPTGRDPPSVT